MFAKLYETDVGQVLVKFDNDDESRPEVRFYFEPETLSVCSIAYAFKDNDTGWDKAESIFKDITEEKALNIVELLIDDIKQPG